jgi:hypothetical protein
MRGWIRREGYVHWRERKWGGPAVHLVHHGIIQGALIADGGCGKLCQAIKMGTHRWTENKSTTRELWLTRLAAKNSLSAKRKFAAQRPDARYVDFRYQEQKNKSLQA